MDFFQRCLHSTVRRIDADRLLVASSFLDLEHSFHLELTVRLSTRSIEAARASMSKHPLERCLRGVERIDQLAGLSIEQGILKELNARFGGNKGCIHMLELLSEAVRLTGTMLIAEGLGSWTELKKEMTEEEIVAVSMPILGNTCLAFGDDQRT